MNGSVGRRPQRAVKDEERVVERLGSELGLTKDEAAYYLRVITHGHAPASGQKELSDRLSRRGMVILSGDNKRIIPVHPRLGLANFYRTWRENMVREINERRMRVDKLILELIPIYEAATEKRTNEEGG